MSNRRPSGKFQKRVSYSQPLSVEHHLLIKFVQKMDLREFAGTRHGRVIITSCSAVGAGKTGWTITVNFAYDSGASAPKRSGGITREAMADSSMRAAKVAEILGKVPPDPASKGTFTPHKTAGGSNRDRRADEFDKAKQTSLLSTQYLPALD